MNCVKCNFTLERVRRKKYQRILLPNSKRYVCYSCNKIHLKLGLPDSFINLIKLGFK